MQMVLDGISKKSGAHTWLYPMSFALQRNAVTVLLGATRAGKTSLMRIMAGLDTPSAGKLTVDGVDATGVSVRKRNVSMVYQQFINYPSMNVARNIASPMRLRGDANVDEAVKLLKPLASAIGYVEGSVYSNALIVSDYADTSLAASGSGR